jgi:hypothetical protein
MIKFIKEVWVALWLEFSSVKELKESILLWIKDLQEKNKAMQSILDSIWEDKK